MKPYQVGGVYDRPIPRRMVEEQEVRRGTFATTKNAASIPHFGFRSTVWSPHTLEDLRRFERHVFAKQGVSAFSYYPLWAGRTTALLGVRAAGRSAATFGLEDAWKRFWKFGRINADVLLCNHPRYHNMAFLWAVDKIRARYPSQRSLSSEPGRERRPTSLSAP